jgi:hypothetical protein
MPKFSVISVDYEHHVPRDGVFRGLQSISQQTYKDFELIICHDGPKQLPYDQEFDLEALGLQPIIMNTPERMADWGHSSRDFAMRRATGDYFVQFNIDNLFYPDAFAKLANKIDSVDQEIVIFTVRHWKAAGGQPFPGVPPVHCGIDCMQLVASRRIWEEIGYWYRKDPTSDGLIYQAMCDKYPWVQLSDILGENF